MCRGFTLGLSAATSAIARRWGSNRSRWFRRRSDTSHVRVRHGALRGATTSIENEQRSGGIRCIHACRPCSVTWQLLYRSVHRKTLSFRFARRGRGGRRRQLFEERLESLVELRRGGEGGASTGNITCLLQSGSEQRVSLGIFRVGLDRCAGIVDGFGVLLLLEGNRPEVGVRVG